MISIILIILACCLGYIFIGSFFGILLFTKWHHIYDEPGAFICGVIWPLSLPVLLCIFLSVVFVVRFTASGKKNWESRR